MITRFRVQNYKALRDVTLELTPMHLLIGPNDSGKTSILEALGALCRSVDKGNLSHAFTGSWSGCTLVWQGDPNASVVLEAASADAHAELEYSLSVQFLPNGRAPRIKKEVATIDSNRIEFGGAGHSSTAVYRLLNQGGSIPELQWKAAIRLHEWLSGVQLYRWNPRFLALPVAPDSKRRLRMEPSGFGLAQFLDDILGYDRHRFIDLENRFRGVFPQIRSIKLISEPAFRAPTEDPEEILLLQSGDGKSLFFEFENSSRPISAAQVSDGLLLVLAYLAILYSPEPPRVILVEEPENGIHPKRLEEVMSILRHILKEQSETQILLTTHSPYVVDLFTPEEVTLCHKEADGSVSLTRLSESESVRSQVDVFTLGEIWTGEGDEALTKRSQPTGSSVE